MPHASILELERPPLDRAPAASPPRPGAGYRPAKTGRLSLIELCAGELGLTLAERQALISADLIVYERPLAAPVASVLPFGLYAEPAPATLPSAGKPIFERCLRFALEGWNVVQLIEPRPAAARAGWIQEVAGQLVAAGVSSDMPVSMLVDAACGRPLRIETHLRAAHSAIADQGGQDGQGVRGGLTMVLGPIAAGPAPQAYAFAANGLAG